MESSLVINPQEVMSHFCWAYCNALLEKLISLDEEDRVFEDGATLAWKRAERGSKSPLTKVTIATIGKIEEQTGIDFEINYHETTPKRFGEIIKETEEFLNIFKKPVKSKTEPKPNTDHYGPGLGEDDNSLPQVEDDNNIPF